MPLILIMEDLSNEILAYSLQNAIEFGKTAENIILPKLFQHGLEKKDISKILPKIKEIVSKVNSMKNEERLKEFENLKSFLRL